MTTKISSESVATTSTSASRPPGLSWWQAPLLGAGAAAILNLAVWGIANLTGARLALADGGGEYPITVDSVAFMSVAPMVVGVLLAAVIARWWPGVIRVAQVVGALLAMGTLWSVPGAALDAGTTIALTAMHLASAVVVVLVLEGLRRRVRAAVPPGA